MNVSGFRLGNWHYYLYFFECECSHQHDKKAIGSSTSKNTGQQDWPLAQPAGYTEDACVCRHGARDSSASDLRAETAIGRSTRNGDKVRQYKNRVEDSSRKWNCVREGWTGSHFRFSDTVEQNTDRDNQGS